MKFSDGIITNPVDLTKANLKGISLEGGKIPCKECFWCKILCKSVKGLMLDCLLCDLNSLKKKRE